MNTDRCSWCGTKLEHGDWCPRCCEYVPMPDRYTDGFAILQASEDEDIDPAEHTYEDDEWLPEFDPPPGQ